MINTSGWEPVDNLLLVKPVKTALEERLEKSGLEAPDGSKDKEAAGESYVRVVAVGPGPWKRWDADDAPVPGELLLVKRYAWTVLHPERSDDGERYWVLQEDDVFLRRLDRAAEKSLDFSNSVDKREEAA